MQRDLVKLLEEHGIQPSAQRLAVAEFVLTSEEHPGADRVLAEAQARLPMISRATVYNTLNLFCQKGLLRELVLAEGKVVFDCNLTPHHHFLDEESGLIHDVPWQAVEVAKMDVDPGFEVREYMVVMRGRRHRRARKKRSTY